MGIIYKDKPTCVYIINVENTDVYKIGISNNIKARLDMMQSGNHNNLILIKTKYYDDRKFAESYETFIHSEFLNKQIKREWFCLNNNDLIKINIILETDKSLKELKLSKRKNRKYNNPKRVVIAEKFKQIIEIDKIYNTNEIEDVLDKLYDGNKEQILKDLIFRQTNIKNKPLWVFKRLCKLSGYNTEYLGRKFIKKKRVSLIKIVLPESTPTLNASLP